MTRSFSAAARSSFTCSCASARLVASSSFCLVTASRRSARSRSEPCTPLLSSSCRRCTRRYSSSADRPSRPAFSASKINLAFFSARTSTSFSSEAICSLIFFLVCSIARSISSFLRNDVSFLSAISRSISRLFWSSRALHCSLKIAISSSCSLQLFSRLFTSASRAAYSLSWRSRPPITCSMPSASVRVVWYSLRSFRTSSFDASSSWVFACRAPCNSRTRFSASCTRFSVTELSSSLFMLTERSCFLYSSTIRSYSLHFSCSAPMRSVNASWPSSALPSTSP
mmetsp:Transcript_45964/g.80337  ORF Transcript_45964/g.80337 Transcript_45964/m.80337 type:complete len:283 (+) Transcript_45964:781-1629(+)